MSLHRSNNGDVDLYLGDGLISDLGTTLKDNCQNNDPKCESSVQDVLRASGNYDLQSRQVGLVLAVGGILLGMFAFQISETWKMDQSKPVPMHFNLGKEPSWNMLCFSSEPIVIARHILRAALHPCITSFVPDSVSLKSLFGNTGTDSAYS